MSPSWVLLAGAAAYGAAAGALLPRALYRLAVEPDEPWRRECPQGHPLGRPRTSAAGGSPAPGAPGGPRPGIRGSLGPARCAECAVRQGHPPAYGSGGSAFAVAGSLVCAVLAAAVGPRPELAVWLLATPCALLLTAVDLRVRRLPDPLTLPLAGATAALLGLASLLPGAGGSWRGALLGGVVLAGFFLVLHLVRPREMGYGDVKLALTPGVALGWYGWEVLFAGAFLGFLLFAVYGAALMLVGRAARGTHLAFGPFMVLGALGGAVLGGLAV